MPVHSEYTHDRKFDSAYYNADGYTGNKNGCNGQHITGKNTC